METAAIEAGRWLRRTGRVSLPVRSRRNGRTDLAAPRRLTALPDRGEGE